MKKILRLTVTITILSIIFSCGSPSEEIKDYPLTDLVGDYLSRLNEVRKKKERESLFGEELKKINNIVCIDKSSSIVVNSREADKKDGTIISTIPGNRFVVNEGFYLTTKRILTLMPFELYSVRAYISPDNVNWYAINGGDDTLQSHYYFDTEKLSAEKGVAVTYSYSFSYSEKLKKSKIKGDKKLIQLTPGSVYLSSYEERVTADLEEHILYIPEGTVLAGFVDIKGNLLEAGAVSEGIKFSFLRDIFVYLRNKIFSISFDRMDWGVSILSFSLNDHIEISYEKEGQLDLKLGVNANYKGD